jgi:hypothetical protein
VLMISFEIQPHVPKSTTAMQPVRII